MACLVLSGLFALSVQGVLLAIVLGVLLGKWLLEWRFQPRPRKLLVFTMDSSKQLVGAGWIHLMSIAVSEALASNGSDQCAWYLINIVLDATLGCFLQYVTLHAMHRFIRRACGPRQAEDWIESGHYYDVQGRFRPCRYLKQLLIWVVVVVTLMKLGVVLVVLLFRGPLTRSATLILRPFQQNARLELLFVMVGVPSAMNAMQFWAGDNIIKSRLRYPGPGLPLVAGACNSLEVDPAMLRFSSSLPARQLQPAGEPGDRGSSMPAGGGGGAVPPAGAASEFAQA